MQAKTPLKRRSVHLAAALTVAVSAVHADVKLWDGGAATAAWTDGANWSADGVPGAADDIVFDNSLVNPLPAQFQLTDTPLAIRTFTWNSNDSSDVVTATAGATASPITLLGNGVDPLISMGSSATGSTFRFIRATTGGGTGTLSVVLGTSGSIHVDQAGATLRLGTNIAESTGAAARITKTGAGLLDISGFTHTYTGGIAMNGGTVNVTGTGNVGTTPAAANALQFDGGAMRFSGAFNSTSTSRGVQLDSGGGTFDVVGANSATFAGAVTGVGRLHKTGSGTLWLSSGSSAYQGGVHILGGTVRVAQAAQLGSLPVEIIEDYLRIDGGTLLTLGSFALGSTRGVQIDSGGATFNVGPTNTASILGVIKGDGGITKVGDGTFILSGVNTFAGSVSVQAGRLIVRDDSALGATAAGTTVQSGAALVFDDDTTYTATETVTIAGTGVGGTGAIENLLGVNTFAGNVVLAADSTIGVTAGELTVGGGVSGANGLTVAGSGVLTAGNLRVSSAQINNPAVKVVAGRSTANTSVVNSLTLAAASQLDLADQDLMVDHGGGGTTFDDVRAKILSGYAGGAWTGPGIVSSVAAGSMNTALGYAEASSVFDAFPASFSGQMVDDTAVLVRFTLKGDADLNGTVDIDDFGALAANFNATGPWRLGDFDYSGTIDIDDFGLLAAAFNQSLPGTVAAMGAVVPEPSSIGLIALAAVLGRRRR